MADWYCVNARIVRGTGTAALQRIVRDSIRESFPPLRDAHRRSIGRRGSARVMTNEIADLMPLDGVVVDVKDASSDLDAIIRQADDAFDKVILAAPEDDDISAGWWGAKHTTREE